MIGTRSAMRARHELRFGTRELLVFAAVGFFVCVLTFVGGVLVGREMGSGARSSAKASPASAGRVETAPPASPGPPVTSARPQERLTFYRTLTAPTPDLPLRKQPIIEERIVPEEDAPAVLSEPTLEKRPASAPVAVARRESTTRSRPAAESPLWTVQVSSFRSRALAEELRARLATRGLDAYLLSVATEEGRVRYRVRVGAYPTRTEAERVATELRSDRMLSPFVTPRSR